MVFTDDLCGAPDKRVAPHHSRPGAGRPRGQSAGVCRSVYCGKTYGAARRGPGTRVQFCEPE